MIKLKQVVFGSTILLSGIVLAGCGGELFRNRLIPNWGF
jgi:hypothetical protein